MGRTTRRIGGAGMLGVVLGIAGLIGCVRDDKGPRPVSKRPDVGAVTVVEPGGQRRTLAEYRGRVVLVDVWATWCPPCRRSLPELAELQRKADERYAVLAISVDKGGFSDVQPFLQSQPALALHAVVPDGSKALDPFGSIVGIPTTLIIDRQGRLRERWSGYYEGRAAKALQDALREP